MEKTQLSIQDYLDSLDDKHVPTMKILVELIQAVSPTIKPTVWQGIFWGGSEQSILGFGDYHTTNAKKEPVEWFFIGLARQKNYYSIYINAVKGKHYLLQDYQDKLGKAKVGSANITFTKIDGLDLEMLKQVFAEALEVYQDETSEG